MSKMQFLELRVACFLCCTLLTGLCHAENRPNIVLVMADDQGWGDMAYNGHPVVKTPNFDKMARECFRFDRFYAAAPVCSPTRGSVMTGRHPNRFGCFKWGYSLRPQEVTVAEALKSVGYVTGHFGKWHLGSVRKNSPVSPGGSGFDEWVSAPNFYDNDPVLSVKGKAVAFQGESSIIAADLALEFMKNHAGKDQPFFAVVWFGSPHSPHRAVAHDAKLYTDQKAALKNFYGEITGMDRALGKIRAGISNMGLKEKTILWYCSDNGALRKVGSTGGHRGHKGQVYEGGLLVPAILEWPAKFRKHRNTMVRCNTSDIYPTVLEMAGVKVAKQPLLDGISLVDLIQGKATTRSKPMGFWDFPAPGIRTPAAQWMSELLTAQQAGKKLDIPVRIRADAGEIKKQYSKDSFPGHAAWIEGDWKLHRITNRQGDNERFELYNLKDDPAEKMDLAEKEPERMKAMEAALTKWQNGVIGSLNGADYE